MKLLDNIGKLLKVNSNDIKEIPSEDIKEESRDLNNFEFDYKSAINHKLRNKVAEMRQKLNVSTGENNIDNKLLLHYDKNYDKNYDNNQHLNREIMDKNRLIYINEDSSSDKDNYIFIIMSAIYLAIYFVFICAGLGIGLYGRGVMYLLIGLGIAYYIYILLWKLYWHPLLRGAREARNLADATARGITRATAHAVLPHYMLRYSCPKRCKRKTPPLEPVIVPPEMEDIREMKTDSTINTWVKGDQPEATWGMRKTVEQKKYNKPQPGYGPIDKKYATVYHCKWDGAEGGNLATERDEFYGYVPCQYYPGYKTTGKYIGGQRV